MRIAFAAPQRVRSKLDANNAILNRHLLPLIGDLRLDEITYTVSEDLKLALASKRGTRSRKTSASKRARCHRRRSTKSGKPREIPLRNEVRNMAPKEGFKAWNYL